jgi:hypothetical protein
MDESISDRIRHLLSGLDSTDSVADASAQTPIAHVESKDDAALQAIGADRSAAITLRTQAIRELSARHRRDKTQADFLASLFGDPDEPVSLEAIRAYPPFEPRMAERLHRLLTDAREAVWSEAASLLARRKDPAVLARFQGWLRAGDVPHVRVALLGLESLLSAEDRLATLEKVWAEHGGMDEAPRAWLAVALLKLDDDSGLEFLAELAIAGRASAVPPIDELYDHDPDTALELMHLVLEHASREVGKIMADRVRSRMPRTVSEERAELMIEARAWVEAQRSELDRRRAQEFPGADSGGKCPT